MRKRYEVAGMMEWHPVFSVGRSRLAVSFTGGHLCGGGSTPASFETADAVVQAVIESSEAFRNRRIRLAWSRPGAGERSIPAPEAKSPANPAPAAAPSATAPPVAAAATPQTKMETKTFATIGEASDYLHFRRHVPTSRLLDAESCRREALKLGIVINIRK